MSTFTKEMVNKYANDLLIGLSDEENKMVLDEFTFIEKNMDLINDISSIEEVEPMTHPFDLYLAKLDEDKEIESIPVADALRNSDKVVANSIEVPKVVG